MYLMYVDESGDPGISEGSSEHYILAALVIHHAEWEQHLLRLKQFRKQVQQLYGIGLHTEIHATDLIRIKKQETYKSITKKQRINILAAYANCLTEIFPTGSLITIHLDKASYCSNKTISEAAWQKLLIKYHEYLQQQQERGMVIADEGNETTLRYLLRNLRREKSLQYIVEDFSHRSSKSSYFIQTVDVIAFLLYKKMYPKGAAKKYNLDVLFDRFSSLVSSAYV
jgi:hypothetical protein